VPKQKVLVKKMAKKNSETVEQAQSEQTVSEKQTEKEAVVATEKKEDNAATEKAQVEAKQKKAKKKQKKERAVWVEYKPQEIVEMIVNLANQGHSASEIGIILKDQHGVLNVKAATKKTILEILQEAGIKQEVPEDLLSLIRKAVALDEHLKKNKKDASAKRGYEMSVSKIRRLTAYYLKKKRLPANWRYDIETAKLLVK
jgi:ribosomal protein S15P/S13E